MTYGNASSWVCPRHVSNHRSKIGDLASHAIAKRRHGVKAFNHVVNNSLFTLLQSSLPFGCVTYNWGSCFAGDMAQSTTARPLGHHLFIIGRRAQRGWPELLAGSEVLACNT